MEERTVLSPQINPVQQDFLDGRLPPQNLEAEEAILGSILMDPGASERLEGLDPAMFYLSGNQIVYRAIQELLSRQMPPDLLQVSDLLERLGKLDDIGGRQRLAQLADAGLCSASLDGMIDLVRDKWRRREMARLGGLMNQMQHSPKRFSELYEEAESMLLALAEHKAAGGLRPLADIHCEMFTEVEARANGEKPPGVMSGYYDLDEMTGGFQPGDLIVLAARPGMGKTSLALEIALNAAESSMQSVAVFSLEMSAMQLAYRMTSARANIEARDLRCGTLNDDQWGALIESTARQGETPVFIDESTSATLEHIKSESRKLKARSGNIGLILVDYLQLMETHEKYGGNEAAAIGRLSRGLKQLAMELGCPIICLSQLNRAVEGRQEKRPKLSDLRSSGAIEQDADLVAMLYREENYDEQTTEKGIAELLIVKHRSGPMGTIKLLFDERFTSFKNLAN